MIDRNFIMAVLGSMTLIVAYNIYYEWRFGDYIATEQETALLEAKDTDLPATQGEIPALGEGSEAPVGIDASPVASPVETAPAEPVATQSAPMEEHEAMVVSADEKLITVNTGVTHIVLSNIGATPVQYLLEKYHDKNLNKVDLRFDLKKYIKTKRENDEDVSELKKVKKYPLLGLKFSVDAFSDKINKAVYSVSEPSDEISLSKGDAPYTIRFEYADKSGIVVRKSYTFHPDSYEFDFSVLVKSTEKWKEFEYSLVWFGLGGEDPNLRAAMYSYHGPIAIVNKKRVAEAPDDEQTRLPMKGNIAWAALTSRYYAASGIPEITKNREVVAKYIDDRNFALEWKLRAKLTDTPDNITFFLGPKENHVLGQYDNGMYSIIDYGWFDLIAKPLFWVMNKFHGLTGNWGWSIILLTIVVKVLFFPLTQKGFKSMRKMQTLQPHLKKIQAAYKDDKEKLNQAMMGLYKEHKVNPLGGCLPMILQIPIFFALYKTLLESIELKGVGWILWIHDLSLKDPYYVTPVLMGVSMLVQQMMTPKTGDPMQRKIMMAMPFIFTFMFLSFPVGLVIYWLVNNILTIGQQWIIYREAK